MQRPRSWTVPHSLLLLSTVPVMGVAGALLINFREVGMWGAAIGEVSAFITVVIVLANWGARRRFLTTLSSGRVVQLKFGVARDDWLRARRHKFRKGIAAFKIEMFAFGAALVGIATGIDDSQVAMGAVGSLVVMTAYLGGVLWVLDPYRHALKEETEASLNRFGLLLGSLVVPFGPANKAGEFRHHEAEHLLLVRVGDEDKSERTYIVPYQPSEAGKFTHFPRVP